MRAVEPITFVVEKKTLVVCCKCARCSVEFCCLVLKPMVQMKKLAEELKMFVA